MASFVYASIKVLELVLCLMCTIYKRVSDFESNSLRLSQERDNFRWFLLRHITWDENGSSYADITYGSYVLITTGLIIGYLSGELSNSSKMEYFFLGFGALLFIAVGSLELAALDSVPHDLVDNAAILGVLSLLTGFLFILDMLLGGKRRKSERLQRVLNKADLHKTTQTDSGKQVYQSVDLLSHKVNGHIQNGNDKSSSQSSQHDKVVGQLKSSLKGRKSEGEPLRVTFPTDILDPPSDTSSQDPGPVSKQFVFQKSKEQLYPEQNISKEKTHPGAPLSDESDSQSILSVPTVAFLKGERGEQYAMKGKPSRTQMLPMTPIATPSDDDRRSTVQSVPPGRHEKQPTVQKDEEEDSEDEFTREIVIMTPSEREQYLNFLQRKMLEGRDSNDKIEIKTYTTMIENIQLEDGDDLHGTPSPTSHTAKVKEFPHLPSDRTNGRSIVKKQEQGKMSSKIKIPELETGTLVSSYDFCEDLSNMSQRERERYLFGESPNQKDTVTISHKLESPKVKKETKFPMKRQESEGHWRFDSRDANLTPRPHKSFRDERDSPSSPMDPGYVRHTAHNWPQSSPKTPSQSPTEVPSETSQKPPYRLSSDESDSNGKDSRVHMLHTVTVTSPPKQPHPDEKKRTKSAESSYKRPDTPDEEDEDIPHGGSLTTQLLQKWLRHGHTKASKVKSIP